MDTPQRKFKGVKYFTFKPALGFGLFARREGQASPAAFDYNARLS
jgi:hypothetical protein